MIECISYQQSWFRSLTNALTSSMLIEDLQGCTSLMQGFFRERERVVHLQSHRGYRCYAKPLQSVALQPINFYAMQSLYPYTPTGCKALAKLRFATRWLCKEYGVARHGLESPCIFDARLKMHGVWGCKATMHARHRISFLRLRFAKLLQMRFAKRITKMNLT